MTRSDDRVRVTWKEVEAARVESGLSQRKLARVIGVSQGHLSKVLRGEVPDTHNILGKCRDAISGGAPTNEIDGLLREVRAEALRSREFRQVLYLMLRLVQLGDAK